MAYRYNANSKRHDKALQEVSSRCISELEARDRQLTPEPPQPRMKDKCHCWGKVCKREVKVCNAVF